MTLPDIAVILLALCLYLDIVTTSTLQRHKNVVVQVVSVLNCSNPLAMRSFLLDTPKGLWVGLPVRNTCKLGSKGALLQVAMAPCIHRYALFHL